MAKTPLGYTYKFELLTHKYMTMNTELRNKVQAVMNQVRTLPSNINDFDPARIGLAADLGFGAFECQELARLLKEQLGIDVPADEVDDDWYMLDEFYESVESHAE